MLSDPSATATLGRVGRTCVLADYSLEAVSRRYGILLDEAVRPAEAGHPS